MQYILVYTKSPLHGSNITYKITTDNIIEQDINGMYRTSIFLSSHLTTLRAYLVL